MFEIRNIDIQTKMIFHFNKSFPKCAAPDKFPTCSRLVGINRDNTSDRTSLTVRFNIELFRPVPTSPDLIGINLNKSRLAFFLKN